MADDIFGQASIVLSDGTRLANWRSYSINSDFLTPVDGWSFDFGTNTEWLKVKDLLEPGNKVEILVDDVPQCTGWIDVCGAHGSASGGTVINVQGRDILAPMCKCNVHPDTEIKGLTLIQLIENVVGQVYLQQPPDILYSNDANRLLIANVPSGGSGGYNTKDLLFAAKEAARQALGTKNTAKSDTYSAKCKKVIDYCKPHVGESAFEFCARNLRRFGMWMWATAEGAIVVAGPNYDQEPTCFIRHRIGDAYSQVESASVTWNKTNIPDIIVVRGKSSGKSFTKKTVQGSAKNKPLTSEKSIKGSFAGSKNLGSARNDKTVMDKGFISALFIAHDQAESPEQAEAFAMQELTRLKQEEYVLNYKVAGHRDPRTGVLYQTDTVAHVADEVLGIEGEFYVSSRTFQKSVDGGTSTDLKLVPLGAIQFSDLDAPK